MPEERFTLLEILLQIQVVVFAMNQSICVYVSPSELRHLGIGISFVRFE